eukprot:TRINITY_DN31449_c0_g1_i1.p1 TRINITY_DN31449_c0_g1~~TRINITY_DN31449_c0_g1_i1.p1  ORF type:complete len:370 (+),score=94.96 TRINITY_DN31449_c0_g1_i1:53-1162(+)
MASPSLSVTWSSSACSSAPRNRDAVVQLHKLHFVDKKGDAHVKEMIEAKCKEGRRGDKERERAHKQRLKELNDAQDHRLKHCLKYGSTSIWTKEERDKIEDLRQDPDEAREKMVKHMKHLSQTFREEKSAMSARVYSKPPMNVRPRSEWEAIEEARQDPEEATAKMKAHMQELRTTFREQKGAMTARLSQRPRSTFWTKEQREKIEDLRQDPDEAHEKMTQHMQMLSRTFREEKASMMDRVNQLPAMTFRSKEERDAIEELRQDPDEAREKMTNYMKELGRITREQKADVMERVNKSPRKTFWTPEERDRIEEARRDPEEAKAKAEQDMRELSEKYREQKREIEDRVKAIPRRRFCHRRILLNEGMSSN